MNESANNDSPPTTSNLSLHMFTVHPNEMFPADMPRYLLLTPHQYAIAAKCLFTLRYIIIVGGVLGNVLSIRTFARMGLKDTVTITFFHLAISDLACLIIVSILAAYYLNEATMIDSYYSAANDTFSYYNTILGLDPFVVNVIFMKLYDIFFYVSSSLITFLAIQRSLCVVRPLQFKGMFSGYPTVIVLASIWGYWLLISVINWLYVRFKKVDHGYAANTSKITMTILRDSAFYRSSYRYRTLVNYTIIPSFFLVAVFGGLVIMTHALMKSVRFRQSATNPSSVPTSVLSDNSSDSKTQTTSAASGQKSDGGISSSKEWQAIMQVAILLAFFILSQLPAIVWNIVLTLKPEINREKAYSYFSSLVQNAYITMDAANASVNFLVYYKYNTRFRQVCFRRIQR